MIEKKNKTVVVGMSGGVDSSVAAALLLEQGYTVIGLTMKTHDLMEVGGVASSLSNCCDLNAVMDAHAVAEKLGIQFSVVNLREEFEHAVIDDFVDEYLHGRTPNPCVICNREIKWGVFLKKAEELGAEYIATGHYARVRFDQNRRRFVLSRGMYSEKDQSYALWSVRQEALAKTIFPLGELSKPDVRKIAEQYGFCNARKHESFEICFIPDDNYVRFLTERLPDLKERVHGGEIILDDKVVGNHSGYPFYTIGQRKNIGAYGQKMYVRAIDSAANRVYIGTDAELHHRTLIAGKINGGAIEQLKQGDSIRVQAKVRYKDQATDAVVSMDSEGKIKVIFDIPKRAITPGQSVVLYDGDDVLMGGVIESVCS